MKKYGLAALLVALAAGVSYALRPLLADFPALVPLAFLGAIAVVARFIDFRASIFTLCASAALLDVFFFPPAPRHSMLGVALAKTVFFVAVGASLSALMQSLREARESRARLAAIVDSSNDAIISLDLKGIVTSWNAAAVQMFGYPPEQMMGHSILQMIPPEFHEQETTILRNLRDGKRVDHFETEGLRRDGSRVKVSLTISPLMDWQGRVVGASRITRDITERVKMQNAFIESEKLAATGRMAAAIAHEINNPLEAVTNLAFLINTNKNLDSTAKGYSEMLMDEIHRISNVAKRSLTFFRDTGKPVEFDVAATLDGVLDLNSPLLAQKDISVRRDYAGPSMVFGSSAEMRQVFSNLIRNAIDAISTDGQIAVRIRAVRGGNWRISVADNGHGIQPDARERLFQPFVTTKGNTGNGLGLWISRGIVENHGGQIRARSALIAGGSWTVFSVVLPASQSAAKGSVCAAVIQGHGQ
jgi:PAS domain S-box-containing protein